MAKVWPDIKVISDNEDSKQIDKQMRIGAPILLSAVIYLIVD